MHPPADRIEPITAFTVGHRLKRDIAAHCQVIYDGLSVKNDSRLIVAYYKLLSKEGRKCFI